MEKKRIILLIETSRAYGRNCVLGVASYAKAHDSWNVLHFERGLTESLPSKIEEWRPDGIISRLETKETAKAAFALKIPTVDLRGVFRPPRGALLDTDPHATAILAAEHLLDRGFQHFAYCGMPGLKFSDQREEAFVGFLSDHGLKASCFRPDAISKRKEISTLDEERFGETHIEQLIPWVLTLPRPIGVMACNDVRGRQVIRACTLAGLRVPEEIAVVGVDDDEVICELCNPPLSSVVPDTHQLGFTGARILDEMLSEGMLPPEDTILIPPLHVTVRPSSDCLALADQEMVHVVRFIRQNACKGINVNDVIDQFQVSRSTLERRFSKYFQCGAKEYICQVRFDRVKTLLRDTEYDLRKISQLAGFKTAAHLVTAFKRDTGQTPGEYREGSKT